MKPPVAVSRRAFAGRLLAVVLGAASLPLARPARAQQGRGRLNPDERERLREDLRQRGAAGWPGRDSGSGAGNPGPGYPPGGRGPQGPGRERLSDDEREQLRRQLREAGRRRD
ncbi:MAG: hypothetical protein ACLGHY_06855 [Gammaproteobacteria bacterium]